MQKTEYETEVSVPDRRIIALGWIASVMLGALLSCGRLFGLASPLAVSLTGILPLTNSIFVFIGAMISYMISGTLTYSITDVTAMLVIMTAKVVICGIMSRELRAVGNTVVTGVCYAVCSAGLALLTTIDATVVAVLISRVVVCTFSAYIIYSACEKIIREKKVELTPENAAIFASFAAISCAALCSMSFVFVTFGRVMACLLCIVIARRYGASVGAVCGSVAVVSMLMFSPDAGRAAFFLPLAVAVAGLMSEKGISVTVPVFLAVSAMCALTAGVDGESARTLADALVASVAAILIPEKVWARIFGASRVVSGGSCVESAASRLEFAAQSIKEMRRDVERIADSIEKRNDGDSAAIIVCDRVCGQCRNNLICWERDFDKTNEAFAKIAATVSVRGAITENSLPQEMSSCFRKYALVGEFNSVESERRSLENARRRIKDMRGILCEQFCSMEDMLMNISSDIAGVNSCDEKLTRKLRRYLEKKGAESVRVCVSLDCEGRMNIQGYYSGKADVTDEELSDELFEMTERDFSAPTYSTADHLTAFTVSERARFTADFGVSQRSAVEGEVSGDTAKCFCDGAGNASIILSDGMGQGSRAAVDSRMTAVMISRLLGAGVGLPAAVRLLNSSMQVKSADESFATLDITNINLFNGNVEMIKFGAAATFILSGGEVSCREEANLPLGILPSPETSSHGCRISDGDVIAVVSDGVPLESYETVKTIMCGCRELTAQEISDRIIDGVVAAREDIRDDISVAVVRLSKNKAGLLA